MLFRKGRGNWSSSEHWLVRSSIYCRGIGLLQTLRVTRSATPSLLRAQREALNLPSTARLVLSFMMPYCTPTPEEAGVVARRVARGDREAAEWLRSALRWGGIDPNSTHISGRSARSLLCIAAAANAPRTMAALLDAGADVNRRGVDGREAALHVAAREAHVEALELLLSRDAAVDMTASKKADGVGECSFIYRYIVRESCSQFDSLPLTSLTISRDGVVALALCATARDVRAAACVRALLGAGAAVDRPSRGYDPRRGVWERSQLCTALTDAVRCCDTTPSLRCAAVVGALLEGGASLALAGAALNEGSLLHAACSALSAELVRTLLAHGADPSQRAPRSGKTPLVCAAEATRGCVARRGDDARRAAWDTVAALLRCGAKPDPVDLYEPAALFIAAKRGHLDVLLLLLDAGAEVDRVSTEAKTRITGTSLFVAAMEDRSAIVEVLLRRGADASLAGAVGGGPRETPLGFAKRCRRLDVCALLAPLQSVDAPLIPN
jgi:ankyrin repeat protein